MSEPSFCDLCTSETGALWTWYTPNPASSLEEAKARDVPWFEDDGWLVCDTCHRLILAGKRESVLDRALRTHQGMLMLSLNAEGVAQKIDAVAHINRVHAAFWDHKNDVYERTEA
jgi:hypothetical protein